jgi:hypothetical protein
MHHAPGRAARPRSGAALAAPLAVLALATGALAACGGGNDTATPGSTVGTTATGTTTTGAAGGATMGDSTAMAGAGAAGGSLSDPSTVAQLDSVASAARTGLTALPPAVAASLLSSFERKLSASNDPALTDIAKDLGELRAELTDQGGQVDGEDVGEVLRKLGPKVTKVADRGGSASGTLRTIGEQLTAAGGQLKQ